MDCFVAFAPRNDGRGGGCDKLARRAKLRFTRNMIRFIRIVIPSRSEGRAHVNERGTGMRWTCVLRLTSATCAYGKSVWSRRRGAGVNVAGRRSIFRGTTEAKEPFSGESTL